MRRVENLLLEIVEARLGTNEPCSDGEMWGYLERLAEEVLLLRAERERDVMLERSRGQH